MFEDKVVLWKGDYCHARVVGCDIEIGISVVDANDPELFLLCIDGPLTTSRRGVELPRELWDEIFLCCCNMFAAGKYDISIEALGKRYTEIWASKFNVNLEFLDYTSPTKQDCCFNGVG